MEMKRIYIIGIAFLSLLGVSCSEWMDVRPKTEIEANELFSSEDGFKNALTGVYARMTGSNLYGRELTFDLLEDLVQRYDAGMNYSSLDINTRVYFYNYTTTQGIGNIAATKTRIANVWNAMYTDIVNINSLLAHLEDNGREVIHTDGLFEIIKGEALALRAFHYFDLLRMWGPADLANNGDARTVPYRTKVGWELIAPMPADSLVIKIEEDLVQADSLLVEDPCIWNYGTDFLAAREHRMNKWAVRALMARFYLYTNQPDLAAQYARDVVDNCGRSLVSSMKEDHAMLNESLFALHYETMPDDLENYFSEELRYDSQTQKLITPSNLEVTFETADIGGNDIRARSGQGFLIQNNVAMSRKYLTIENSTYDCKVPLIRLAEMYYILAETLPANQGYVYFNDVRNSRGVPTIYNATAADFADETKKMELLQSEYCKEFFGEGQYFFFLKRRQVPSIEIWNGNESSVNTFPMLTRYYEFEIPDSEKEYGLVPNEN